MRGIEYKPQEGYKLIDNEGNIFSAVCLPKEEYKSMFREITNEEAQNIENARAIEAHKPEEPQDAEVV